MFSTGHRGDILILHQGVPIHLIFCSVLHIGHDYTVMIETDIVVTLKYRVPIKGEGEHDGHERKGVLRAEQYTGKNAGLAELMFAFENRDRLKPADVKRGIAAGYQGGEDKNAKDEDYKAGIVGIVRRQFHVHP